MDTTLAQHLRAADQKAQYDASCKRLLSEKMILAWIMKQCVAEYADCDVKEIAERYIEGTPQVGEFPVAPDAAGSMIHGSSQEDVSLYEGIVTYDIRFLASAPGTDGLISLIINVEAQNDYYPGYPLVKRGIYYCSRLISAQYGTEFTASHYEKIKKVYSIWICMDPPKSRQNTITQYAITEKQLVGHVEEKVEHYDLMTTIMIGLGNAHDENYAGVLKLLDVLFSEDAQLAEKERVLQDDFGIPMTEDLEQEVSTMCNLSKGVEERAAKRGFTKGFEQGLEKGLEQGLERGLEQGLEQGLERGLEQGLERGLEQGLERGLEQGRFHSIQNLMDTLKLSMSQAMDALKIPAEERSRYEQMLQA